jgi:cation:H+ antiporter
VGKDNLKFELPFCIVVSVILLLLVYNFFTGGEAVIGRVDGLILLLCFAFFMFYSFYRDRKQKKVEAEQSPEKPGEKVTPLWWAIVKVVGGLAVLITSCDFFIDNAIVVAKSFGVSDAFISITLIACGTSLPELAASLAAALKKNTDLALGNVIGSCIFNITWILGLSSQVMPLNASGITFVDYAVMIASVVLATLLGLKGKINRVSGALIFLGFIAYNWYLISTQIA